MKHITSESEFRDEVIRHSANLPPQQRLIADFLLENLPKAPFFSVPELARRVGVSEATIVRFAQRIGFQGFSELKMSLVEILQNRLGVEEDPAEHFAEDTLDKVADLETRNIRRTLEGIDRATFVEVADAIFRADHCYIFGMGVSAHLAELAGYTLTQIGVRATTLSTRFSSPREQLVAVRPSDLLLTFSFPPYSRQSLEVLGDAGDRGAQTVAISDRLTSPAASIAQLCLAVKSDNTMFTNAVAAVTVLINALATEIASRHRGQAIEAFSHINRILTGDDDVLMPKP
jgi:DNA-binding MurR/RpiR family transcriptional regulator